MIKPLTLDTRGVHGSVRFRLKKSTEPNYSIVAKIEPNRIENRFKPNQSGSVKFGFLRKKPGNLIPWVFLVFDLKLTYGLGRFSIAKRHLSPFYSKKPAYCKFSVHQLNLNPWNFCSILFYLQFSSNHTSTDYWYTRERWKSLNRIGLLNFGKH